MNKKLTKEELEGLKERYSLSLGSEVADDTVDKLLYHIDALEDEVVDGIEELKNYRKALGKQAAEIRRLQALLKEKDGEIEQLSEVGGKLLTRNMELAKEIADLKATIERLKEAMEVAIASECIHRLCYCNLKVLEFELKALKQATGETNDN